MIEMRSGAGQPGLSDCARWPHWLPAVVIGWSVALSGSSCGSDNTNRNISPTSAAQTPVNTDSNPTSQPAPAAAGAPLTLAVLGDSDSHAYHDTVMLNFGTPGARGGVYQASTWQWTELLADLRARHIDQGRRGVWGVGSAIGRVKGLFGLKERAPRKQDFEYNFAISGATCSRLNDSALGQVGSMIEYVRSDPSRWASAVVLIRIGVNDLGTAEQLGRFASVGLDSVARRDVAACVNQISAAVAKLKSEQPAIGIVLVGILNNVDWPRLHGAWQSAAEQARIAQVMDAFDAGLKTIAASNARVVFHDDRAWFAALWGSRDANGVPAYRAVNLGGVNSVTMTEGDAPTNAVIADGHAGTAWNGLWARQVVRILNSNFGYSIPEISDSEIAGAADPRAEFGIRPK